MQYLIEQFGWIGGWLINATIIYLRYLIMAGLAFLLFYRFRKASQKRKIQSKLPAKAAVMGELKHSLLTAAVFALVGLLIYQLRVWGYSRIYLDLDAYGWWYLPFSFILLAVIHDTYFYWMHRALHHPRLFPIFHKVHHQSWNPTPLASLAFHPLEALLEIAVIPMVVLVIPFHPLVLLLFATWSLAWNILGHLGYELFPKGFVEHPIGQWFNTSTHHNLHHARSNGHFGLYFNFWDRVMGTNFEDYHQVYKKVVSSGAVAALIALSLPLTAQGEPPVPAKESSPEERAAYLDYLMEKN